MHFIVFYLFIYLYYILFNKYLNKLDVFLKSFSDKKILDENRTFGFSLRDVSQPLFRCIYPINEPVRNFPSNFPKRISNSEYFIQNAYHYIKFSTIRRIYYFQLFSGNTSNWTNKIDQRTEFYAFRFGKTDIDTKNYFITHNTAIKPKILCSEWLFFIAHTYVYERRLDWYCFRRKMAANLLYGARRCNLLRQNIKHNEDIAVSREKRYAPNDGVGFPGDEFFRKKNPISNPLKTRKKMKRREYLTTG